MPETNEKPVVRPANTAEKQKVNAVAILAYVWILFLVPLVLAKDDPFVKFHLKQGIALFVGELALWILMFVPYVGWLLGWIGEVVAVILSIIGILNALQGKTEPLPLVGKYAESFKI